MAMNTKGAGMIDKKFTIYFKANSEYYMGEESTIIYATTRELAIQQFCRDFAGLGVRIVEVESCEADQPRYDEAEFREMVERGTEAWADVTDDADWVENLRGGRL